ncbi:MAG: hypothetical protein ACNS60_02590 [Candidatus Cyclobacteriaceae bacterium M2_1C_046]
MPSNNNLWKKLVSAYDKIQEQRLMNRNKVRANKIFFDELFSEILVENNLNIRQSNVRYHFDFANTEKFYSDFLRLKIILKHLLVEAFEKSKATNDPEVMIHVNTEGIRCRLSLEIKGYSSVQQNEMNSLGLIHKALDEIKGKIKFINEKAGISINLMLPDLYAIQNSDLLTATNINIKAPCI